MGGGQRQTVPQNRQQFSGAQQNFAVPSINNVPACADCEGFNPFVNPADFSHQQIPQQQQRFRAPAQQPSQRVSQFNGQPQQSFQQRTRNNNIQPAFLQQPSQPTFNQQQQLQQPRQFRQSDQFQAAQASPAAINPGQLSLNRFQNGFNFDFTA